MPDISKCTNTLCVIKTRCYRFTAKDNIYRQSYSHWEPVQLAEGEVICEGFWRINGKDHINKQDGK